MDTMTKGFQCTRCKTVYSSADELRRVDTPDPYSTGDMVFRYELFCPKCGSDNLADVFLCQCGEITFDYHPDCATCIAESRHSHLDSYDQLVIDAAKRFLRRTA